MMLGYLFIWHLLCSVWDLTLSDGELNLYPSLGKRRILPTGLPGKSRKSFKEVKHFAKPNVKSQ